MIRFVRLLLLGLLVWLPAAPAAFAQDDPTTTENTPASPEAADNRPIDAVTVEGNLRIERETILNIIKSRPGSLHRDIIAIDIRALYDLGFFEKITARIEDLEGRRTLIYRVVEKRFVREIVIEGNDEEKTEDLQPKISLKPKQMIDYGKMAESVASLKAHYAEKGFYIAEVNYELIKLPLNEVKVVFKIAENHKVMIRRITFIGSEAFGDEKLKEFMETKEKTFYSWITSTGSFSGDALERDRDRLMLWYLDNGYLDIKIDKPIASLSADRRWAYISITLHEGEQYRIGKIGLSGDVAFEPEEMIESFESESGEIYCHSCLMRDMQAVTTSYGNLGYAFTNIDPQKNRDTENLIVDIDFNIDKGRPVYINRIRVFGNTVTREKVIRREMRISEGQLYNTDLIQYSERRINSLGFFKKAAISTEPIGDDRMNLVVSVEEGPTGSVSAGVGFSSIEQFFGQGQLSFGNMLGYGVKTFISAEIGPTKQNVSLRYSDPYFLDTLWTFSTSFYSNRRELNDVSEHAIGGSLTGGYLIDGEFTRLFLTYRYEYNRLQNLSSSVARYLYSGTTSSLILSLNYNTLDHPYDPTTGMFHEGSVEYAGGPLGGDFNFVKVEGRASFYFNLTKKLTPEWPLVLSLFGKIGYAYGTDGKRVPYSERYFLGGIDTIRAYDYRSVSPTLYWPRTTADEFFGTTKIDYGGNKRILANAELVFPLIKQAGIKGVVFYDIGQAYLEEENYFEHGFDLRQGWGLGFRWFSPVGPLRFEWGFPINPQKGDAPNVFNFSIGTFF